MFITLEGGEGTGKSTQAQLLKDYLVSEGYSVLLTREPGGTRLGEEIRRILITGSSDKMGALSEALIYCALRAEHWEKKIKPALEEGQIVICDRFHDSCLVYQGICKGVSTELLNKLYIEITQNRKPDRTYLLDLPPEIGIERSLSHENSETRFEKMDISFHKQVRQAFLDLANKEEQRFAVIDGKLPVEQIQQIIKADLTNLLGHFSV